LPNPQEASDITDEEAAAMLERHPAEAVQERMLPAAEPAFLDDLGSSWGAHWGASDEVGPLRRVVVRRPGDEFDVIDPAAWDEEIGALVDPGGMWYWTGRRPPQLELIQAEHDGLVSALRREGVEVDVLSPLGGSFIKGMYIRDPFVTVTGGAIVGRMAVRMRRGEEREATRILGELGVPILGTITGAGTLEGGSFVKISPGLAALGTSVRCNSEGARQLKTLLEMHAVQLIVVPLPGYTVHLDVHLAMVDVNKALIDVVGLPYTFMQQLRDRGIELIPAHPSERPWALNVLCLRPGRILMAQGTPRTTERLEQSGIEVRTVPYAHCQPNGGGIHCSTNELIRDPASG
jgi:N-dimethylarginine dimethylaminohydrolase